MELKLNKAFDVFQELGFDEQDAATMAHKYVQETLIEDSGDMESLYPVFLDEMPYGVAKARTGDPFEYIMDRLDERIK